MTTEELMGKTMSPPYDEALLLIIKSENNFVTC